MQTSRELNVSHGCFKGMLHRAAIIGAVCSFSVVGSAGQQGVKFDREFRYTIAPSAETQITLVLIPKAACHLHGEMPRDKSTVTLISDRRGYARFSVIPPPNVSKPSTSIIDCQRDRTKRQYKLKLYVSDRPSALVPAPKYLRSQPDSIRPALAAEQVNTMSDRDLKQRGYEARPDKNGDPLRYALWRDWVTHPVRIYVPDIVRSPNVLHPIMHSQGRPEACFALICPRSSNNWSGFELVNQAPTAHAPFNGVRGRWNVPIVSFPAGFDVHQEVYSSTWVGIDGDGDLGLADLAQGGTEQQVGYVFFDGVPSKPLATAYAWTELLPTQESGSLIANFDVKSGDDIEAVETIDVDHYGDQTTFTLTINNYTQREKTTISTRLGSVSIPGKTAEWIMERPTSVPSMLLDSLPVFLPFNISNAVAYWGPGPTDAPVPVLFDRGSGYNLTMVNGARALSTVSDIQGDAMRFTYRASQ